MSKPSLAHNSQPNNLYLLFFYITKVNGHAELVSASHREPFLVFLRGQILKQVQDDHLLWAIVICYIEVQKQQKRKVCPYVLLSKKHNPYAIKILYKTVFPYKSSWKAGNALLENFCFPTGKLFFLSWKFIFFQ